MAQQIQPEPLWSVSRNPNRATHSLNASYDGVVWSRDRKMKPLQEPWEVKMNVQESPGTSRIHGYVNRRYKGEQES